MQKLYSETSISNIADAIRAKGGTGTFTVGEMAQAIEDLPSGGGTDYLAQRLMNTMTDYSSNEVTKLVNYSFINITSLKNVSLPNCSSIGDYAFQGCTGIETFSNNVTISTLGRNAFDGCTSLTSFPFERVGTSVLGGEAMFRNCSSLTGVYAPQVDRFALFTSNQFYGCSSMTYARFPNNSQSIRSSTFNGCTALKLIDLGSLASIGSAGTVFVNCPNIETLILRRTSMTTVRSNEFANTANIISVYVPSSLVSTYETGTNWSSLLANNKVQFVALEGSPYEATDFVYNG